MKLAHSARHALLACATLALLPSAALAQNETASDEVLVTDNATVQPVAPLDNGVDSTTTQTTTTTATTAVTGTELTTANTIGTEPVADPYATTTNVQYADVEDDDDDGFPWDLLGLLGLAGLLGLRKRERDIHVDARHTDTRT